MRQAASCFKKRTEIKTAALKIEWISIQYLRAIAAILVVVYHLGLQATRLGYAGSWPAWTAHGVDIFFVISGMLMWSTTVSRDLSPLTFLRRRAIRIVPLYYLLTSLTLLTMAAAPAMVRSGALNATHIFASYLFLPSLHPVLKTAMPLLVPGWTLNYEVYFYVLFALTLMLPERWRVWATFAMLSAPVMLRPLLGGATASAFYGSSIVLEFWLGLGMGFAVSQGRWLSAGIGWWLATAGALVLAIAAPADLPRILTSGLPALAIVAGAVTLEHHGRIPRIPLLRTMGDASYALYLSHGMMLSASVQALRHTGFGWRGWMLPILVVGGLAISQALAILVHRYIERPLIAVMSRQVRSSPSWDRA